MKRRLSRSAALAPVTALVVLAGCTAGPAGGTTAGTMPVHRVGGDTVVVAPVHSSTTAYAGLREFVGAAPIVVTGRVVAADDTAYEVLPDPDAEGVLPGEGPDLYGSITFAVTATVKGRVRQKQVEVVYESGKRESADRRIAYTHEGLSPFQTATGELRSAAALTGREFLIFAAPNTVLPVPAGAYVLAHPLGVAAVAKGGAVTFPGPGSQPFGSAGTTVSAVTLAQVRSAVR